MGSCHFDMIAVDGYTMPFGRDSKNPQILNGVKGLKAEMKGNLITVVAPCGWKCQYLNGKIASITSPRNTTLEFRREADGLVAGGYLASKEILRVERGTDNKVHALIIDGRRFDIELAEKPRIQELNGQNIVTGLDSALGRIASPNGLTREYSYTPTEKFQSRVKISQTGDSDREIVWDSGTRFIVADSAGSWNYVVKPSSYSGGNADIQRTNSTGQTERWYYDWAGGKEITQEANGIPLIKTWFVSGKLAGSVRKVEKIVEGKAIPLEQYIYGEDGRLLRKINENGTTDIYEYTSSNGINSVRALRNGQLISELAAGPDGSLLSSYSPQLGKKTIVAREDPNWSTFFRRIQSRISPFIPLDKVGRIASQIPPGENKETFVFYDTKGAKVGELRPSGALDVVRADISNPGVTTFLNGVIQQQLSTFPDGRIKQRLKYAADGVSIIETETHEYDSASLTEVVTFDRRVAGEQYLTIVKVRDHEIISKEQQHNGERVLD